MDEAEHLADRVAVIDSGHLVALGSPEQLREAGERDTVISLRLPTAVALNDLPSVDGTARLDGDMLELASRFPTRDLNTLSAWAIERGLELESLRLARPSLEEVYLRLTDRGAADG
jgi:ABC-2 type transport system ATP-binding protein